jgi:hypothetical protein
LYQEWCYGIWNGIRSIWNSIRHGFSNSPKTPPALSQSPSSITAFQPRQAIRAKPSTPPSHLHTPPSRTTAEHHHPSRLKTAKPRKKNGLRALSLAARTR